MFLGCGQVSEGKDWNEKFMSHNCLWTNGAFPHTTWPHPPLCRVALLRLMPVIKQVDIRANTNLRGTYMALRNVFFFPSIYFDSISQKSVIIY